MVKMFGLGNRAAPEPAPEPERQDGPSDAEVIARAAWLMKTAIEDPAQTRWRDFPNVPLVDLCLDLRAVLIRSDAGRAVIRPHEGGPMQVDRIDRELKARDEQIEALGRRAAAAEQDLAEVQHELAEANKAILRTAGPIEGTAYVIKDGPKMLRETLCVAQAHLNVSLSDPGRKVEHMGRLQRLIDACDRHRPIGPDGKHGNRHTATCGCNDKTSGAHEATPGTGEEQG